MRYYCSDVVAELEAHFEISLSGLVAGLEENVEKSLKFYKKVQILLYLDSHF